MSQDTTPDGDDSVQTNEAEEDLCDFLAIRSELEVEFEKCENKHHNQKHDRQPVARTADGNEAKMSDFPSGKNDSGGNFSKKTFTAYASNINDFIQSQNIEDLNDVEPKTVNRWHQAMQRKGNARTTRDQKLTLLRSFFEWTESQWRVSNDERSITEPIERMRNDLSVSPDEKSRAGDEDRIISVDKAEKILGELARHEYASREMTEFLLIYHVGLRQSGIRSINCGDVRPEDDIIKVKNLPEDRGVRLKKGDNGERHVVIKQAVMNVVQDYMNSNRSEPNDGSNALFTTNFGRISKSTLYKDIEYLTRCGDCEDKGGKALTKKNASQCSESISPHDLRRVAVTRMRDNGMTWEAISGRANSSIDVLKQFYDSASSSEKAERRRKEVLNAL